MGARVLVVDDDRAILSGLRRALALDGYDVLVAENGETALTVAEQSAPDLIVLDVKLPDLDGLTVCSYLRAESTTPILILSAKDTVPDRVAGLDRGADDYLVKPFAVSELLARTRALLRRTRARADETLSYGGIALEPAAREATRAGGPLRLTAHEFDLLALFLKHPRQVLSREQLCQHVWGCGYEAESNFIDVAIKELRKKLEEGGHRRLIQTVRGVGYVLREE